MDTYGPLYGASANAANCEFFDQVHDVGSLSAVYTSVVPRTRDTMGSVLAGDVVLMYDADTMGVVLLGSSHPGKK